jgi:hypothetical protein
MFWFIYIVSVVCVEAFEREVGTGGAVSGNRSSVNFNGKLFQHTVYGIKHFFARAALLSERNTLYQEISKIINTVYQQ